MGRAILRRLLFVLIALVVLVSPAYAAIAVGGHITASDGAIVGTLTTGTVTTQASGSSFYVLCSWQSVAGTLSATDNKGNGAYTQIGTTTTDSTLALKVGRFYKPNGTGGSGHTFTCNQDGTVALISMFAFEITGGTATPLDVVTTPTADSSSPFTSPASGTLSQANELIVSFAFDNSTGVSDTFTASGGTPGFTLLDSVTDGSSLITGGVSTEVVSATTTQTATWSSVQGTYFLIGLDTFKATGGGGSTVSAAGSLQMLGVGK